MNMFKNISKEVTCTQYFLKDSINNTTLHTSIIILSTCFFLQQRSRAHFLAVELPDQPHIISTVCRLSSRHTHTHTFNQKNIQNSGDVHIRTYIHVSGVTFTYLKSHYIFHFCGLPVTNATLEETRCNRNT